MFCCDHHSGNKCVCRLHIFYCRSRPSFCWLTMSVELCGYCKDICNHTNHPYLTCESCSKNIHLTCLKQGGVPSTLLGDVFFTLCCQECSQTGIEEIAREKLPWIAIVIITLYNLEKSETIMADRYFHYKNDICYFIDKHFDTFRLSSFGTSKKTKNWFGTVSGILSVNSPQYFVSSSANTDVSGCWKLAGHTPPKVLIDQYYKQVADSKQEAKCKRTGSKRLKLTTGVGTSNDLNPEGSRQESVELDLLDNLGQQSTSSSGSDMFSRAYVEPRETLSKLFDDDDDESSAEEFDLDPDGGVAVLDFRGDSGGVSIKEEVADILEVNLSRVKQEEDEYIFETVEVGGIKSEPEDSSSEEEFVHLYATKIESEYEDDSSSANDTNSEGSKSDRVAENDYACVSDSAPGGALEDYQMCEVDPECQVDIDSVFEIEAFPGSEEESEMYVAPILLHKSLFTVRSDPKDKSKPWEEKVPRKVGRKKNVHPMSAFEESQLLERLRSARTCADMPSRARRLHRKLCVRRLHRAHGTPVFNIDARQAERPAPKLRRRCIDVPGDERVLDRFHRKHSGPVDSQRFGDVPDCPFVVRLTGQTEQTNFYSCYTQRVLKAYIYRDRESNPPWLALMDELLATVNKGNPRWVTPKRWPIDYSYVRPQHIPSVNSLCKEYFYPGIELSDALAYPDFSCVALYKRLVVGFAFMVPDVGFNETYITFLFVRPEWRRAGIATFMVYHLIQTCMGKDVTLHVSATNPAVLLYQKFGFKVEEFVQDFYDKYLPVDSKDCKHAIFLRLTR